MSGNHGAKLDKALRLVVAAKEAGADAIKLQTYRPDTITVNGRDERFLLKSGLWKGKYLHELYQAAMTPWEWHPSTRRTSWVLFALARHLKVQWTFSKIPWTPL